MNFSDSGAPSDGRRDQDIRGVPVLRDLEGHMCGNCGNRRYVLAFRMNENNQSGTLVARCSYCREPKELTPSEIERECQPQLRNH